VCIGPYEHVCALISTDEFKNLFGGYATYTQAHGTRFIGVWGARKAARFRRLLRERGAEVFMRRDFPCGLERGIWVTTGKPRKLHRIRGWQRRFGKA
jgi:hypothetical protein